ncbi:MAG TPA: dNTP triphosphohydrolase [Chthoniobacterales bacterium]
MNVARNSFYQPFDTEIWGKELRPDPLRTPFEQERDRVIYTAAFRRLQAKTQVFLSGEYDFYRTRLTHSIEVAQIGRSICQYLKRRGDLLGEDFFIDPDLVEAICLAHDLGHPPFGHAGERTLHRLMARDFGGFEGNAQSLRMITRTIFSGDSGRRGLNPTRAFADGILKYKTLFGELPDAPNHYLYDSDAEILSWVLDDIPWPIALPPGKARNSFRSIECQIMDWADDTAYSLNDLVDCINGGFLRLEAVEKWAETQTLTPVQTAGLEILIKAIRSRRPEPAFGRRVGAYIRAVHLSRNDTLMAAKTNRHAFTLEIAPEIRDEAEFFKRIARELVFRSPQIRQLEHKGDRILEQTFKAFLDFTLNPAPSALSLFPTGVENTIRSLESAAERARVMCDYLAGMTDGFAIRSYKRLFDPDFGSLAEIQ